MQNETEKVKKDIKSLLPDELAAELSILGEPSYRAKQVFGWLQKGKDFSKMTNLTISLRQKLQNNYYINRLELLEKHRSVDGTEKYLWKLPDTDGIESVVMKYKYGNTVCISSQAGCRMGCAFCASTIGGFSRNLLASEMIDQVLCSELEYGQTVSNIVLMGIGEPLDNFDNVIRFIKLITLPEGRGIGMRRISVSTCGLTEGIDKLCAYNLQLTLSISLHAPDDETRSLLMPVNKLVGVDRLLESCKNYFRVTGRRVSFEYAMIEGINDTDWHARLLAEKIKKTGGHVNLIPLNNVTEREFRASPWERINYFVELLEKNGVNTSVRRTLGEDIAAACGQLRRDRAAKTDI